MAKGVELGDGAYMVLCDGGMILFFDREHQLHRAGSPAVIWPNGSVFWHCNGKRHREDGPAAIWANGHEEYWLNGKRVDKF